MNSIILLVQFSSGSSGAFFEYDTPSDLFDGLCQLYERGLRLSLQSGDKLKNLTYELSDLIAYLDHLPSLRVLVQKNGTWQETDKEWTKNGLTNHLRQQLQAIN